MAKRGRPTKPPSSFTYIVEIDGWDWNYTLSVNNGSGLYDAVFDWRMVVITGKPRGPKLSKASRAEVRISPDWRDEDMSKFRRPVPSIGSMSLSKGVFGVSQCIPRDALAPIISMLIADRFKFVRIVGTPLHYGSGEITGFSLLTRLEDDEDATSI